MKMINFQLTIDSQFICINVLNFFIHFPCLIRFFLNTIYNPIILQDLSSNSINFEGTISAFERLSSMDLQKQLPEVFYKKECS